MWVEKGVENGKFLVPFYLFYIFLHYPCNSRGVVKKEIQTQIIPHPLCPAGRGFMACGWPLPVIYVHSRPGVPAEPGKREWKGRRLKMVAGALFFLAFVAASFGATKARADLLRK